MLGEYRYKLNKNNIFELGNPKNLITKSMKEYYNHYININIDTIWKIYWKLLSTIFGINKKYRNIVNTNKITLNVLIFLLTNFLLKKIIEIQT